MKPTVQAPDFYKIGNDYAQGPLSSFFDDSKYNATEAATKAQAILGLTEAKAAALTGDAKETYDNLVADIQKDYKFYQDGIFTKLADTLSGKEGEYKADYWKNPEGFNKRRVFVGADETGADSQLPAGEIYGMDASGKMDDDLRKLQPAVKDEQYSKADIVVPDQYEEPAKQAGG